MTDPQDPPPPSGLADPTRDIRLPPRPGTPGPDLPPEWEALQPAEPPPPDEALAELPTDEVASRRPETPDRDPTLTFDGSARERWAAGHAATPDPVWSAASGSVVVTGRRRPRRWPWVVLTLLPLVVIAVSGVWLLLLMR